MQRGLVCCDLTELFCLTDWEGECQYKIPETPMAKRDCFLLYVCVYSGWQESRRSTSFLQQGQCGLCIYVILYPTSLSLSLSPSDTHTYIHGRQRGIKLPSYIQLPRVACRGGRKLISSNEKILQIQHTHIQTEQRSGNAHMRKRCSQR